MTGPEATCPDMWNQVAFGTVGGPNGLSGHPLSDQITTASLSLPHMALSLVEGTVVSPFLRFAEAPAGFLSTVDFISNIRGQVYRCAEPEQFGICVSHESSTEVGGPEQLGQSHEVFEDPTLLVFYSATVTVLYPVVTL